MAAVYAVTPSPSLFFLVVLFLWLFAWEIGGQNIPADWTDIEEDRHFQAQTIPVRLGTRRAGVITVATLTAALILNMAVLWASPLVFPWPLLVAALAINIYLLLQPALKLAESQDRADAMKLFNKASHYPLANLALLLVCLLVQ